MVALARRLTDLSAAATRLRARQLGLLRFLARDLRAAWPRFDPQRPASAAPWIAATQAVIDQYARMSAELAARAYDAERAAAGVAGRFTPALAEPPPQAQVEASLRWATHQVWTPPAPAEGLAPAERVPESRRIAERLLGGQQMVEAVSGRLVLDAGRRTVADAVERDPAATGWYRSAKPTACYFCRLMASRGAVYKSRGTAGANANARFEGDGEFKFHDSCQCVALPVLRGDVFELSPEAARWDEIYRTYAAGHPDQMRRFRIAIRVIDAGRTPTEQDFAALPH